MHGDSSPGGCLSLTMVTLDFIQYKVFEQGKDVIMFTF